MANRNFARLTIFVYLFSIASPLVAMADPAHDPDVLYNAYLETYKKPGTYQALQDAANNSAGAYIGSSAVQQACGQQFSASGIRSDLNNATDYLLNHVAKDSHYIVGDAQNYKSAETQSQNDAAKIPQSGGCIKSGTNCYAVVASGINLALKDYQQFDATIAVNIKNTKDYIAHVQKHIDFDAKAIQCINKQRLFKQSNAFLDNIASGEREINFLTRAQAMLTHTKADLQKILDALGAKKNANSSVESSLQSQLSKAHLASTNAKGLINGDNTTPRHQPTPAAPPPAPNPLRPTTSVDANLTPVTLDGLPVDPKDIKTNGVTPPDLKPGYSGDINADGTSLNGGGCSDGSSTCSTYQKKLADGTVVETTFKPNGSVDSYAVMDPAQTHINTYNDKGVLQTQTVNIGAPNEITRGTDSNGGKVYYDANGSVIPNPTADQLAGFNPPSNTGSAPPLATCPAGQTGTPPNCVAVAPPQPPPPAACPAGQTGTPPNCVAVAPPQPPPPAACPAGQTGTPPNCVAVAPPPPPPAACPAGQTGTPPNCVAAKSDSPGFWGDPNTYWGAAAGAAVGIGGTMLLSGGKKTKTVTATSTSTSSSTSTSTPNSYGFAVSNMPTTATTGVPLPAMTVNLTDTSGNPVTSGSITVTATCSNCTFDPKSTTSVQMSGGVVTFSNLIISSASSNAVINFSGPGAASYSTFAFSVNSRQ